jgi:adenosine kinase
MKGLSLGQSLPEAAALGSVCAAFCVEKKGTQEHSFSLAEFNASLTAHFGRTI